MLEASVKTVPLRDDARCWPLAHALPGALFVMSWHPNGGVTFQHVSDDLSRLLGVTPAEAIEDAASIWNAVLPEDRSGLLPSLNAAARALGPWQFEGRFGAQTPSGRWCQFNALPQSQADGGVVFSGFVTDITAHKAHEAQWQTVAAEFNDLYHQAPCGYHSVDADGVLVRINDTELSWLGYHRDELVGKVRLRDLLTPASQEIFAQRFPVFLQQGRLSDVDLDIVRKDGSVLPVRVNATAMTDANGRFVMSRSVVYDMTAPRHAERVQARLNRALRLLSRCNMALVHSSDENALLQAICRLVVDDGGYRMAWIGYAQDDSARSVRPVAQHGFEDDYLHTAAITWADTERGRGPTGTAIREGSTQVNQNFLSNPHMAPWREAARQHGYQSSIALPLKFGAGPQAGGALMLYAAEPDAFAQDEVHLLEELAADVAFGITNLRMRHEHDRSEVRLRESLESTIQAVGATLEMRDPYTAGHQRRVALLAQAIASEMGLDADRIHALGLAASIHDLGKIRIPAEILTKPGRLAPLEYRIIQQHAQAGFDILQHIPFPWPIAKWIRQHHERLDGSGYPQGLRGDAIDLESRILAVADVIEAITTNRPYRAGLGLDAALQEVIDHRATQYDAVVVDACVRLFREKHYTLPV